MNNSLTVDLPPAFYWDRLGRDLATGTLVRELARSVRLELTVAEALDVRSDAAYYGDSGIAAEMIGEDAGALGLISSAKATLKKIDAALATLEPGVIEAVEEAERAAWAAGAEARAAEAARIQEAARIAQAEREAEREAHPRLSVTYVARNQTIFGLASDTDLRVGAILVTETASRFEIVTLGEQRHGDVTATVRTRDDELLDIKIELATINRKETR